MSSAPISQEELFLPLLIFIADHGGEIERQEDDLLGALADRLGLSVDERERRTEGGRLQWQSQVEWAREKLIEGHEAIERPSPWGVWRLTKTGWAIVREPPDEMKSAFEEWKARRERDYPEDAAPPPDDPAGHVAQRLRQLHDSTERTVIESLRVKRNAALARALKEVYHYQCQLCDPTEPPCPVIPMAPGRNYVEVHHIEGLAEVVERAEHGQLDDSVYQNLTSADNVIVVCPYHHSLLHHHDPPFRFDRKTFAFSTEEGEEIPVVLREAPHLEVP